MHFREAFSRLREKRKIITRDFRVEEDSRGLADAYAAHFFFDCSSINCRAFLEKVDSAIKAITAVI